MTSCHCEATDRHFTIPRARGELATYRRRGPTGTARLMLQCLADLGPPPTSLLDVGAGIGVLHHVLLDWGVRQAVHLDASSAYVEVASEESARRGHGGRVTFQHGDLVALKDALLPADLVTLDRVVCCYPELEALIQASTGKAVRYFALSYPHDRWYLRAYTWWENRWRRRGGNPFRTFVHPVSRIRALLEEAGFTVVCARRTPVWEVLVAARNGATRLSA
ncbi:MAG TPA: class I SAM-dependent methyltransferase [Gemmatimonadales bacterium]|nr:class I SAM-dependent methyltransferase [Gemmatimonadales bacterium]